MGGYTLSEAKEERWVTQCATPKRSSRSTGYSADSPRVGVTAFGINQEELPPNGDGYPDHDHAEDGQEEVFYVLAGAGKMVVDGEDVELAGPLRLRRSRDRSGRSSPATRAQDDLCGVASGRIHAASGLAESAELIAHELERGRTAGVRLGGLVEPAGRAGRMWKWRAGTPSSS